MTSMNNYQRIKEMVLPLLEAHQDDLLIHDKKDLKNYEGDFLYGFRPYGTNIFKMDLDGYNLEKDLTTQVNNSKTFFTGNNKWFFHCKNGIIKAITRDEVDKVFDAYIVEILLPFEKKVGKLNIPSVAASLHFFIQLKKRLWRSELKKLWFDGGAIDDLQRLRNKFDSKVLKLINQNTKEEEIKSLLYKNII
ncbi:MAG TPA: hypothetical protein EYG89_05750 [Bacteroidia bacterium]|nr:hypothetical protein [Bacteroidia bacterium]